jgi:hypothetical protein
VLCPPQAVDRILGRLRSRGAALRTLDSVPHPVAAYVAHDMAPGGGFVPGLRLVCGWFVPGLCVAFGRRQVADWCMGWCEPEGLPPRITRPLHPTMHASVWCMYTAVEVC